MEFRDIYDKPLEIIGDFVKKGKFFLSELESSVLESGSPMRAAPCETPKDYLDNELVYNQFPVLKKFVEVNPKSGKLELGYEKL